MSKSNSRMNLWNGYVINNRINKWGLVQRTNISNNKAFMTKKNLSLDNKMKKLNIRT